MPKTDFKPFRVGTVFNKIKSRVHTQKARFNRVLIKFPSRLNAMAIDPSKIVTNKNMHYSPGEIVFKVKIYKHIIVSRRHDNKMVLSTRSKRRVLILHSASIMKKAIGFKHGLNIDVNNDSEKRHIGLGSSSGLIAGVACAINELYGNPIIAKDLVPYLAQNHGEEIDGTDSYLAPVQCIGGSAAAGLFKGGVLILSGESRVVFSANILSDLRVVIGVPSDFVESDSKSLLQEEIKSFSKFKETGRKFGKEIAYRLFHEALPGLDAGSLIPLGNLIYDYRFKMGSIYNCSFTYAKLPLIARRLSILKNKKLCDVLSLSSVGPAFFVITDKPKKCLNYFFKNRLHCQEVGIENNLYSVISKQ